jgi:hypothetical protein
MWRQRPAYRMTQRKYMIVIMVADHTNQTDDVRTLWQVSRKKIALAHYDAIRQAIDFHLSARASPQRAVRMPSISDVAIDVRPTMQIHPPYHLHRAGNCAVQGCRHRRFRRPRVAPKWPSVPNRGQPGPDSRARHSAHTHRANNAPVPTVPRVRAKVPRDLPDRHTGQRVARSWQPMHRGRP